MCDKITSDNILLYGETNCGGNPIFTINDRQFYRNVNGIPISVDPASSKPEIAKVKSAYIPPNMALDWTSDISFARPLAPKYSKAVLNYGTLTPGTYPNLYAPGGNGVDIQTLSDRNLVRPLSYTETLNGILVNVFRTFATRVTVPSTIFKLKCCRRDGDVNETVCGKYWGSGENCDSVMNEWCHANPTSPYCSCITSKSRQPQCWDSACMLNSQAYRTTTQKVIEEKGCPNEILCNQTVNIDSKYSVAADAEMTQKCQINNTGNVKPSTTTPSTTENSDFFTQDFFVVVLIMLCILIAVAMALPSEEPTSSMSSSFKN